MNWLDGLPLHIRFDDYMAKALYDDKVGYYQQDKSPIGRDFETSATLSDHLAQALAVSIQSAISKPYQLYEIGSGTGQLITNILKYLKKIDHCPHEVIIYDISHARTKESLLRIEIDHPDIPVKSITQPPDKWEGALVANEVLDAMPFRRFYSSGHENFEMYVNTQKLTWVPQKSQIQTPFNSPYYFEICAYEPFESWIKNCTNGLCWLIDYGYGQETYYHSQRHNGTMCCFSDNQVHSNPFLSAPAVDITAHVNWSQIARMMIQYDNSLYGYNSQGVFMQECFTHNTMRHSSQVLKDLMHPNSMGETIKVMVAGTPGFTQPIGCQKKINLSIANQTHLVPQFPM